MKPVDFEWVTDTEVGVGAALLDLHTEYVFRTLGYDVAKRILSLQWIRKVEDWVLESLPDKFVLIIHEVTSVEVSPRDSAIAFTEDDCLRGFAYYADEDWCEEPFWTEDPPHDEWKWVFEFMSGARIIVAGSKATCATR